MFMGGCYGNSMVNTMFKMQMFKAIMNNIFHPYQQSVCYPMQQPVMPMMPQMPMMPMTPAYPSIFPMVQNPSVNYNNNYYNDNFSQGPSLRSEERRVGKECRSELEKKIDKSFKNNGKLGKDFLKRVKKMAKNLNCDYKDLLAVINCESGFDTKANNNGVAVGLTQFTNAAIAELKRVHGIVVTKEQILNMSALEQLDLAEKYLLIAKSYTFDKDARLSADDLYALNFLPGRANREVLCEKGERDKNGKLLGYYEGPGNSGLDKNGDNKITKSELGERIRNKYVDESLFA